MEPLAGDSATSASSASRKGLQSSDELELGTWNLEVEQKKTT